MSNVSNHHSVDFTRSFEECAICLAHVALDGHFIQVNPAWRDFLGYGLQEFTHLNFKDITHPDDLEHDLANLERLLLGVVQKYSLEKRYRHSKGYYVWGRLTVSLVKDDNGDPLYLICSVEDISEQKHSESLLYQSEQKLRTIVTSLSSDIMIWMATPGVDKILYVSQGFEHIFGHPAQSWYRKPKSFIEFIHDDDKPEVLRQLASHRNGHWDIDYRVVRKDGSIRYLHDQGSAIRNEQGIITSVVCTAYDITESKVKEQELAHAYHRLLNTNEQLNEIATTDYLTTIKNRRAMEQEIISEIKLYHRSQKPAVLVMFDLDNFKYINDEFGHLVGDKILIEFANHLVEMLRETDEVGRMGGDEFIVLLRNSSEQDAVQFIQRVRSVPVSVELDNGERVTVDYSAGFAQLNKEIEMAVEWIKATDNMMYIDKSDSQTR